MWLRFAWIQCIAIQNLSRSEVQSLRQSIELSKEKESSDQQEVKSTSEYMGWNWISMHIYWFNIIEPLCIFTLSAVKNSPVYKVIGLCTAELGVRIENKQRGGVCSHPFPPSRHPIYKAHTLSITTSQRRSPTVVQFQKYCFRMRAKPGRLLPPQPSLSHHPHRFVQIIQYVLHGYGKSSFSNSLRLYEVVHLHRMKPIN